MRLYLSAYQLGDKPELFSALVTGSRRGLIVLNAIDGVGEDRRRAELAKQRINLASIGLRAEELDLRNAGPSSIAGFFGEPDFVWVRGGNVFTLRMAMARSGLDLLIQDGLAADRLVYAGFSAGACVLAPDLSGLELCDSVEETRALAGDVRFDGLAILDRPVVPHLRSPEHPESEALTRVAALYDQAGQSYWALRDGQALVVNGSDRHIC